MEEARSSLSLQGRVWHEREGDTLATLAMAQRMDLDPLVAKVLATRGVLPENADAFLTPRLKYLLPDPFTLKDMDLATQRLYQAVRRREKIVIFGDYDVDGATSSALLYRALAALGVTAQIYIPDRLKDGYGPSVAAMERFHKQGAHLVVTLDCGTTAFEPLMRAKELGLDVIVIDHHEAEPRLPDVCALVNPNRLDEDQDDLRHLAAVGVTFVVLVGLWRVVRENEPARPLPNLMDFLDLVALGTVCDVVRLQGLNRAFVSQGLKVMAGRTNAGLCALMDLCALKERPSAYTLGFVLGPRINAGGRVGESSLGARLLTTQDAIEAAAIAQQLNGYNIERQALEEVALFEAQEQALEQLDKRMIVVGSKDWHPGVIGIVAGRLKEQYHKPTFALSFWEGDEAGKGSGRSITGISLGGLVHAAKQKGLIIGGGGHAMAAGLSLTRAQVEDFHGFCEERLVTLGDEPLPTALYDGVLTVEGCHLTLIEALSRLEPFGQGNPSPRFVLENVWVESAFPVGQDHLKCRLRGASGALCDAIAFRCMGTDLGRALVGRDQALHILGNLKKNTWQGVDKAQFIIEDAVFSSQSTGIFKPNNMRQAS
ncbi:MAG: single-stranded-DNA-specific exonuclease RecJ [Candidatus Puniceispirillum sp.]|nr:single-stranded-DNA-specific exonuclease RecJ [Candidatus Puniceispirillum sp.]